MSTWTHQENPKYYQDQYAKDESWLMSTSSYKSFADTGEPPIYRRPGTSASPGMRASASSASLKDDEAMRASLPSLPIKERARNPIIGSMPEEVHMQFFYRHLFSLACADMPRMVVGCATDCRHPRLSVAQQSHTRRALALSA